MRSYRQVIACFCAALLMVGCSDNYRGERLFWQAQKASAPFVKDIKHATPEQLSKATVAFTRVVQGAPGTTWAGRAQLTLGSLSAAQQQYDDAKRAYELVLQNYNQFQDLTLVAHVSLAKLYEVQQQWDAAVRGYQDIADYHPWSVPGLEAPLYIAALYRKLKEPERATAEFERAVRAYSKLILNAPNPDAANGAKGYLVLAYEQLGRWDDAVTTLQELSNVKTGINRPLVLLMLGSIYRTKVNDVAKAQHTFNQIVQEFPQHPFAKVAKAQLQQLSNGATPTAPAMTPPAASPTMPTKPGA